MTNAEKIKIAEDRVRNGESVMLKRKTDKQLAESAELRQTFKSSLWTGAGCGIVGTICLAAPIIPLAGLALWAFGKASE